MKSMMTRSKTSQIVETAALAYNDLINIPWIHEFDHSNVLHPFRTLTVPAGHAVGRGKLCRRGCRVDRLHQLHQLRISIPAAVGFAAGSQLLHPGHFDCRTFV